jgi:thiamine-monophosphate kinase
MSSGEFEIIERYFLAAQGLAAPGLTPTPAPDGVVLGIGDDAALLELPMDRQLVAAVDTLVEGRHFIAGADPRSIGHRALAVNLSDLAAMGATPAWATLALTLPAADPNWLAGFSSGLLQLAAEHGVALVGGDTTRGPLTISVQLLGHLPRGTAISRGAAQAGDLLVVTGTLGDAGAGLDFLQSAAPLPQGASELVRRHEYPTPRVAFGVAARGLASAAMDLSDGLTGDLPKLARASSLAARVDVEKLPMSTALRSLVPEARARELALGAGDDYELLLAVPPIRYVELAAAAARLDLRLTQVGGLEAGEGVAWCLNGEPFSPGLSGYDHFR